MDGLLDTCVLIDLLRRNPAAIAAIRAMRSQPKVCAVSVMELLAGARSQREEREIESLLGTFGWVAIDTVIFRRAGAFLRHYRPSHGIDAPDAMIAATAEHHGLALATLNLKHFPMFAKLKPAY